MSLFYFSLDIFDTLLVTMFEAIEWLGKVASDSNEQIPFELIETFLRLRGSKTRTLPTLFPTFSEENKILASFPSVKLVSHRCQSDRDSASFLFHI